MKPQLRNRETESAVQVQKEKKKAWLDFCQAAGQKKKETMGEGEAADRKEGSQFITEEEREGEKKPRGDEGERK